MRKNVSLLLILVLLLGVLTGCAQGNGKEEVAGSISGGEEAGTPETDEGKEIALGEVGDTVYTNDFAELTFTLPTDWEFATEEQLSAIMEAGADLASDDKQALVEYSMNSTVYDMMAYSMAGTETVMVMFENTARYPLGSLLSVENYIDALISSFDIMEGESPYEIGERTDVKLGTSDYKALSVNATEYGVYQDYLVRREGKYMICIIVTGVTENPSATVGEYFS